MATSAERTRARRARMTAAERTAERTYYAVKRRVDLIRLLSPRGRCACCGNRFPHAALEVDHLGGRLWLVETVSPSVRAARYWREYRAGVKLRALCKRCSGTDGGTRRYHGARPLQPARRRRTVPAITAGVASP